MRISVKSLGKYPWVLRPFFWNQKRKYGGVLQPGLLWARVPKLFVAVTFLYGELDRRGSPLNPILRSLVTVRVSQINWCRFCVDINSAVLAERSGSMEKVESLERWKDSELFDEDEIVELTGLIAFQNLSSKFNSALDVSSQGFCRLPTVRSDKPTHAPDVTCR